MAEIDKPVVWLAGEVKTPPFSASARLEAGALLRRLQRGESLGLPHSRPMPGIGRRCHELRIPDERVTWRVVYRLDPDAVVIGEVFAKKTPQTPESVIENCQRRFDCMMTRPETRSYMKSAKRNRLEAAGWKVGSAADFLGLDAEEAAFVELKVSLGQSLRQWRTRKRLTQGELAKRLQSSQSRVAKMEAADPTVSVDLLVRSLLKLGAKPRDIARAIA